MGADFVVHGGDIQYYDSHLETWAGWFPSMQPLLALGAMQPALGNHEHETDDELDDYSLRFFGHPDFGGDTMWYRYESGGIWFHVLDTEEPIEPGTPQGTWLTAGLAEAAAKPGFPRVDPRHAPSARHLRRQRGERRRPQGLRLDACTIQGSFRHPGAHPRVRALRDRRHHVRDDRRRRRAHRRHEREHLARRVRNAKGLGRLLPRDGRGDRRDRHPRAPSSTTRAPRATRSPWRCPEPRRAS